MAAVFFYSAVLIVQQARGELQRASKDTVGNVASRPATEQ
jgi:hypothetical protein